MSRLEDTMSLEGQLKAMEANRDAALARAEKAERVASVLRIALSELVRKRELYMGPHATRAMLDGSDGRYARARAALECKP